MPKQNVLKIVLNLLDVRVLHDGLCFRIEEFTELENKRTKEVRKGWRRVPASYYTSWSSVFKRLLEIETLAKEHESLQDLKDTIERAVTKIEFVARDLKKPEGS